VNRGEELDWLREGARSFDLTLETAQADALLQLVDELERANADFNLTAIRDRPGMLTKHVLDSLSVQPHLRGVRIADVGTGAGFPGLPLAIVNPARRFTLIEATGKKARYVAQTAQRLKLANVEVENTRAELFRPAAPFDVVIARALSSLADFVAHAGHLCARDGRLLAMKGRRPDPEIAALPPSFLATAVHRISLPGLDDERHLVELSAAGPRSPARPKPSTT
jgi:16S rRNA (guanine527-N7)-methyltransferase